MSQNDSPIAEILKEAGRPMKASDLVALGVTRMALVRAVRSGAIERGARGVYRVPAAEEDPRVAWASLACRLPSAVFCMVSAAAYHGLTQNMAATLDIAVPLSLTPSVNSFGATTRFMRWRDENAFSIGVDVVEIDGIGVRVTNPERTVVDLFRYSPLAPQRRGNPSIVADPETVHDALVRYLHGFEGGSAGKLRKMAKAFGVWEHLSPHLTMLNLSHQSTPAP